ncbi:MAG: NADP-dependent oxidoreductase [Cytophagales bacterium]|nr:MAG: NADP-dependent oxidoreductase [Cytophagales bacterium]
MQNLQIKLAKRPIGTPDRSNWSIETHEVPTLQEGEVLVKIQYISLDPAMRGWMNDAKSYIRPVQIGEVMRAGTAGEVIESKNPQFKVGDKVTGALGVQQYAIAQGKEITKVDTQLAPLTTYLATLGITGLTAYFGLLDIGTPKAGETVLVSAAAGAVGSIVGQIAKIKGCRVVGLAGGSQKCNYVIEELGFDACIDYQKDNLKEELKAQCPAGIDVYFDNVGGDILDLALTRINKKARIIICGAISQYNNTTPPKAPNNYLSLLVNSAKMEGFVVFDYANQYLQGIKEMAQWLKEGKLNDKVHIVKGIETFPETLLMLFKGENFGKLLIEVA